MFYCLIYFVHKRTNMMCFVGNMCGVLSVLLITVVWSIMSHTRACAASTKKHRSSEMIYVTFPTSGRSWFNVWPFIGESNIYNWASLCTTGPAPESSFLYKCSWSSRSTAVNSRKRMKKILSFHNTRHPHTLFIKICPPSGFEPRCL